ncbi:transposase [Streptomyces sp. NBC_01236]|uniref:transposase n=1 Tax=Streptomyces sp. NBC_01236 TaxID=2903789 RepID=UPI002E0F0897|nr:transposase [Streptomyces sp. NBC_01236]
MIVKTTVTQGETHPPSERSLSSRKLWAFLTRRADSGLPELERLARTVDTRWPQIETFLLTGITNAFGKGHNRVIKLTSRCAYGFRNADNQRLRTRCVTTRRGRGCLNPAQNR